MEENATTLIKNGIVRFCSRAVVWAVLRAVLRAVPQALRLPAPPSATYPKFVLSRCCQALLAKPVSWHATQIQHFFPIKSSCESDNFFGLSKCFFMREVTYQVDR